MAPVDDLITRRAAITAQLAAGETPLGHSFDQPSVSIDGKVIPTVEYKASLYAELKMINEVLPGLSGGFEVISRGVP